jgi:MoaA/NifB/PqqE/SkfB family radical SAM enzyme
MDFVKTLAEQNLDLRPLDIETLQVNVGKLCNQACKHCHVDAGPKRTEMMTRTAVERCLEILARHSQIKNLDITGGAPELNENFALFVIEARKLGKHVMVRHNFTVTLDPHPVTGRSMEYLPKFFQEHCVEVISSLPYFQERETDAQRGQGVLLSKRHGLAFNSLYVITNMPINRFKQFLERTDLYDGYMTKLVNAFNPDAAEGVMCRKLISVGYDGTIYDCDFNQMLELHVNHGALSNIWGFDYDKLVGRQIVFDSHCYGCTAGAGSSCGGAVEKG